MSDTHESRFRLDGIVCLFDDFRFIDGNSRWVMPQTLTVCHGKQYRFKEVKSFQNVNFIEVKFGRYYYYSMSIIVASGDSNKDVFYSDVRNIIAEGVDNAFRLSDPNSMTKRLYDVHVCCKEYKKYIYQSVCDNCRDWVRYYCVYREDLASFRRNLIEFLRLNFGRLNYKAYVTTYLFKKNMDWDEETEKLRNVFPETANIVAKDVVLHVGKDFWKENMLLLWNMKAIHDSFPDVKSSNYFCNLTGGHGNVNCEVLNQNQKPNDSVKKFHFFTNIFERYNKGRFTPFKKTWICYALSSFNYDASKFNGLHAFITEVSNSAIEILEAKCNIARIKAMVSLENNNLSSIGCLCEESKLLVDDKFKDAHLLLTCLSINEFEKQLNVYFFPYLKTLREIVAVEMNDREENPLNFVDIDIYHLAHACEMIISFFIYGKLYYWNDTRKRFNNEMREALNLTPEKCLGAATIQGFDFSNVVCQIDGEMEYFGELIKGISSDIDAVRDYKHSLLNLEQNQVAGNH